MTASSTPRRIGLTGGIGSGKSTVAGIWREAGHRVIDLDAYSRAVLDEPGPGVEEAVARFGNVDRQRTVEVADGRSLRIADDSADVAFSYITLQHCDAVVVTGQLGLREPRVENRSVGRDGGHADA